MGYALQGTYHCQKIQSPLRLPWTLNISSKIFITDSASPEHFVTSVSVHAENTVGGSLPSMPSQASGELGACASDSLICENSIFTLKPCLFVDFTLYVLRLKKKKKKGFGQIKHILLQHGISSKGLLKGPLTTVLK